MDDVDLAVRLWEPASPPASLGKGTALMYREASPPMLLDPRIAKRGGTRRDAKANYNWPGMVDQASWRRTHVHQHTHMYGCALCGQKFTGPHAVYTHLAKVHDR